MSVAFIIGSEGQDGRLLAGLLERQGTGVVGIDQGLLRDGPGLGLAPVDIAEADTVARAVEKARPAEVYYLPAYHHSSQDLPAPDELKLMEKSFEVHVRGLVHFLEAIRRFSPQTRLFYAASSHVFGEPPSSPQDETTPISPVCIYGITKAAGLHCCRYYRASHRVFASVGILYNHESPLRAEKFVPQKIVRAAVRIHGGSRERLVLGDLAARVDWGYAPDTVDAMVRILRQDSADDFVVATGEAHTVEEFAQTAFSLLGLDWRQHVDVKPSILGKPRRNLVGDARKLRTRTGWRPSVSFAEMVHLLVQAARDGSRQAAGGSR